MKYIDTGQASMAEFHSLSKVCFMPLFSLIQVTARFKLFNLGIYKEIYA